MSTPTEVMIGRALAICAHPCAAWRVYSASGRAFLVAAYMAAGYAVVLGLLLTIAPHGW